MLSHVQLFVISWSIHISPGFFLEGLSTYTDFWSKIGVHLQWMPARYELVFIVCQNRLLLRLEFDLEYVCIHLFIIHLVTLLSVHPAIHTFSVPTHIYFPSTHLSIDSFIHPINHPSIYSTIHLPIPQHIRPLNYPSIYPSNHPLSLIYPFIHHLSTHWNIYLFIHLCISICLPTYLYGYRKGLAQSTSYLPMPNITPNLVV